MLGIALHNSHQLSHKVVALFQLHIDVCKCVLTIVAQFHKVVVYANSP